MFARVSLNLITKIKICLKSGTLNRLWYSFRFLLNMAFKFFLVKKSLKFIVKKDFHDRWKHHILLATLRLPKTMGHRYSIWIVVTLINELNYNMPCLPPGTYPNCGQTGHFGVDCPTLPKPRQVNFPKFLLHRNLLGLTVKAQCCPIGQLKTYNH